MFNSNSNSNSNSKDTGIYGVVLEILPNDFRKVKILNDTRVNEIVNAKISSELKIEFIYILPDDKVALKMDSNRITIVWRMDLLP
ncbi:translation initiation factor IF-1 [Chlamydia trachomatis]|nr:translation initiation factor IF-1 [Chlamydia trachomatis]